MTYNYDLKSLLQQKIGRQILFCSLITRASLGGLILVVFIDVQNKSMSFSIAGLAMGSITLGLAIGRLLQGFLADRIGFRKILLVFAMIHPTIVIAFTVLLGQTSSSLPIALAGALLGLSAPATSPVARAMWARILQKSNLKFAHVLESTIVEFAFILGPAIAGIGSRFFSWGSLMLIFGGLAGIGAFGLGMSEVAEKTQQVTHLGSYEYLKPLLPVLFLGLAAGLIGGLIEVAVLAFAINLASPSSSGLLIACWGIGSSLGGIAALKLGVRLPIKIRLRVSIFLLGFTSYLMSTSSSITMLAFLVFLHGVPCVPAWATLYFLADQRVAEIRNAEKYTLVLTVSTIGAAIGNYFGGSIISIWGVNFAFLAGGTMFMMTLFFVMSVFDLEKE